MKSLRCFALALVTVACALLTVSQASAGCYSSPTVGTTFYQVPVAAPVLPVCSTGSCVPVAPVVAAPVQLAAPVYTAPVCAAPVLAAPVFAQSYAPAYGVVGVRGYGVGFNRVGFNRLVVNPVFVRNRVVFNRLAFAPVRGVRLDPVGVNVRVGNVRLRVR